jgi:hypothetical protein
MIRLMLWDAHVMNLIVALNTCILNVLEKQGVRG